MELCLAEQLPVTDLVAEQLTETVRKAVGVPWSIDPCQDLPQCQDLHVRTVEAIAALTGEATCVIDGGVLGVGSSLDVCLQSLKGS